MNTTTDQKSLAATALLGRFVVSVVMVNDTAKGLHTMNKLYAIKAVSKEEAHGKALPLAQADFPEHRLHTICSFAIAEDSPNVSDQIREE